MTAPRSPRILVVDDNDALRENLVELLEGEGFLVTAARDGAAALECLAHPPLPEVILVDMMMPGMSGQELVTRVRADSRLAGIRVVLATGLTPPRDSVGADAVLTKPFGAAQLLDTVRPLLAAS